MNDLRDQLEFVTDQSAEPVDLDQALARFLIQLVRSEVSSGSEASPEVDQAQSIEVDER